jgi:hypothetical protein
MIRITAIVSILLAVLCLGVSAAMAGDDAAERAKFVGVWKGFAVEG